ncbi:MAG: PQQ-dependent sugar dehydrogenase [Polyangiales bacterium]
MGRKGGLDAPALAVAPFLDGVFPPRTPNWPGSSQWSVGAAFPNLALNDTLAIASNPADDRIYVGSRDGLIVSFDNQPDVSTTETFLDLRDRVAVVWDGGFLGLVFHPEFGNPSSPYRNTFYAYYSSHCPLDAPRDAPDLGACDDAYPRDSTPGFFNAYLRLSRFEVLDGTSTGDPSSEQVLLNIRLYNGSHRGGGIAFRDDGYLYLTIGDQFHYTTAQDIAGTLEGGSLRLAVDVTDNGDGSWICPLGTHLPRRIFDTSDEISGQHYCIPDDNPWLDAAGSVFEEYCSIGHRNPHRLARDPLTDRLWTGEVGESSREEVNLIECGNNYGWPFREGLIAGVLPEPPSYLGILTDPVIDFTRDEADAIIGGYVYRGSKFPELYGRYLAGDYVTNQIWAITLDEITMTATKVYLANFTAGNLATWGQDNSGEVFMGDVASTGPLYTLERIGDPVPDAPPLLSETGAFSDLEAVVPTGAWVPYGLNQPFWSDGASKTRFIALPNDGVRDTPDEQIAFSASGDWIYPIGTVLMKHFELVLDETDPSITTRLETRFMVLGDDGVWYGLTYRWRADQSDADLLTTEQSANYEVALAQGGTRTQTWYFPSRLDCLTCHRQVSGGALGPRTHQLNGDFSYASTGRTDNQIRTWNDLGMFSPPVADASIPALPRSPALRDVRAPLQDRARSWLDSNCSYCHRPGGANAGFDARFNTPLVEQRFVWTAVRDDLGNPGTVVIYPGDPILSAAWQRAAAVGPVAMPPLAKALPEQAAVDLLGHWIERIKPDLPRAGLGYEYYEVAGLDVLPDFDALTPVATGSVSTVDISVHQRDDDFAFRFRGYLRVEVAGDYTLYISSDDGSQLLIDGSLVVDNDGLHGVIEQSGLLTLSSGYHPIEVRMFERTGDQLLAASWAGPDTGGAKMPFGPGVLFQEIPVISVNQPPVLADPGDQSAELGDPVSLALSGTDEDGDSLYFDAAELPEGLSVDHQSGRIFGTVAVSGRSMVTASASDGPDVSVTTFEWLVTEPNPTPDAGVPDGGLPDAGFPDSGVPDAGMPDAGEGDAGVDPGGSSGGGCAVQSGGAPIDFTLLVAGVALLLRRRRR